MSGPGLNVPRTDPRWPALRRLRPPAFMLVNVGIINIAYALVMAAVLQGWLPAPADFATSLRGQTEWEAPLKVIGSIVAGSLTIIGAWSAFSLRRWGLVVVGAATAVITPTPVCFVGFPFALWMLWVLSMPEVRQHFT
ncbi:hypothetical protein [Archangium lansingense]|uniref:MFS transporter n=1 Tax=Archangium lansingense TaxID=2995310 RepID=A0ABT4A5Y2_9BACT|nr:hypothetical protein [Archangium lansinium]MCY1077058.1 hypothetical protein [Archangium lansinium]